MTKRMTTYRHHGGYKHPPKKRCQTKGCGKWGYGGWCREHTPPCGVGVLLCVSCREPLSEHNVAKLCWEGGGPGD